MLLIECGRYVLSASAHHGLGEREQRNHQIDHQLTQQITR